MAIQVKHVWGVLLVSLVGCATTSENDFQTRTMTLSDAQIATVLSSANDIIIRTSEMALSRSSTPQARQLAERMVEDHAQLNLATSAWLRDAGLAPEDNEISRSWQQSGEQVWQQLAQREGIAFDRAYAQREVSFHSQVIEAIDAQLVVDAQNLELRSLLNRTRSILEQHRTMALQVVEDLKTAPVSRR